MTPRRALAAPVVALLALLPAGLLSWRVLAGPASAPTSVSDPGAPPDEPNRRFFASDPQLAVDCGLARQAGFDPIVHPGETHAGHLHDFFGSTAVDEGSTGADLVGTGSTCRLQADTASYWAPSLLIDGEAVQPTGATAYYRVGPGVEAGKVEPFPLGLAAIAGNDHASGPQDPAVVGFGCGRATVLGSSPPTCPSSAPLNLRVTFPDCWDGDRLDAPDHRAHLVYSSEDGCPDHHPVALPRLTVVVHYPVSGDPGPMALASGPVETAHADFLNGWEPDILDREVRSCLHREVVCAIPDPDRPGG